MISDFILFYPSFRQTEKKQPNKWQKNRKYSVWGIVCRVQTPRGNRIKRWETSTRRSSRKIKAEARDAFRWKDKQKKKNFRVGDVVRLCFFDDVVQPVPLGYGSYTQEALYSHSFVFIQERIIWDNEETTVGQVSFQFLSRIFRTEILESATHPYNEMPI